jgi:hypothetical protein
VYPAAVLNLTWEMDNISAILVGTPGVSSLGDITTATQYDVNGTQISSANLSDSAQIVKTNRANTYSTGLQDFSALAQIELPVGAGYVSAANGELGYDSTNLNWHIWQNAADYFFAGFPAATPPTSGHVVGYLKTGNSWSFQDLGAVASGGTWGALNYPTYVSGSPFVKMTAPGTFALDTSTYLTSNGISGMTSGQLGLAGSASTFTGSIAYATANTASTIVERDASNNINATTFTGALSGNATTATNLVTAVPPWLQNFGNGADSACAPTTGNYTGEKWCTTFNLATGNTLTVNNSNGLIVHATGAITIAGTINARGADQNGGVNLCSGGGAGGSGGGAVAGTAGGSSTFVTGGYTTTLVPSYGGSAGAIGAAGGNASAVAASSQRAILNGGCGADGFGMGGGVGTAGGSTGGARGMPGTGVVLIGASINGTGGVIDLSGQYGTPAAGNSTGSGSPGGGGVFIGYVPGTVTAWPTIISAPGAPAGAGTTTTIVPEAVGVGGVGVSVEPVVTLAVSAGALSGTCTVVTAGTSTATGSSAPANWSYVVLGGGGTQGTGAVNFTWSSGSVASCTITSGSSSGYTAATYTSAGTSGLAQPGWWAKCITTGCTFNQ